MILVTVGTQLPFDRLIKAMDDLAPDLPDEVVAQIGNSEYVPRNIRCVRFFDPAQFENLVSEARLLVAHAGVGSVLTAERHRKPIILFPRRSSLGEHRNDHQLATVAALNDRSGVHVALDQDELATMLRSTMEVAAHPANPAQRQQLLQVLEDFLIAAGPDGRPERS